MNLLGSIGSYFKNIGLSLFGQLKATIVSFLNDFVKDDLGALAVDAVNYAEAALPNGSGPDKLAAAKLQFLSDAKKAGHDVAVFSESILNFLLESALQAVLAATSKGVLAIEG